MASKKEEPKKPYRLPAVGKPKRGIKKSSVREIGVKAARNYMRDEKGKTVKEDITPSDRNLDLTGRTLNKVNTKSYYKTLTPEERKLFDTTAERMSRATGMAKGGLAVKSNAKKK